MRSLSYPKSIKETIKILKHPAEVGAGPEATLTLIDNLWRPVMSEVRTVTTLFEEPLQFKFPRTNFL